MFLNTFNEATSNINPTRNFNLLYIILDSLFIVVLLTLFILKKRYLTLIFALIGGVLYFIVDYGYFYLISESRVISIDGNVVGNLETALVLLWMSLSYGITNFAFIWLCLSKDKYLKYWLILIVGWWLVAPSIATLGGENNIQTYRTTNQYHGAMAIILVVGYLGLIIYYMFKKEHKMMNILWLILIGVSVQFAWEFALLINGIRPMNENSIQTLLVNSLIETNLGMPYIYLIYLGVTKYFNEDLSKKNKDTEIKENKNIENLDK